jgi:hypothetical protein
MCTNQLLQRANAQMDLEKDGVAFPGHYICARHKLPSHRLIHHLQQLASRVENYKKKKMSRAKERINILAA